MNYAKCVKHLGADLKALREKVGWSQYRLALQVGVSRTYIAHLEQGIKEHIDVHVLGNIISSLDHWDYIQQQDQAQREDSCRVAESGPVPPKPKAPAVVSIAAKAGRRKRRSTTGAKSGTRRSTGTASRRSS